MHIACAAADAGLSPFSSLADEVAATLARKTTVFSKRHYDPIIYHLDRLYDRLSWVINSRLESFAVQNNCLASIHRVRYVDRYARSAQLAIQSGNRFKR
jgi:hypothetical protein